MTPRWYQRPLAGGETGRDVDTLRRILGLPPGAYDEDTQRIVRGVQILSAVAVTGHVDPTTAEMVGESATADLDPLWFERDLGPGDTGEDVRVVREMLGLGDRSDRYDGKTEAAIRRLQSANGVVPDGRLTAREAKILGEF